MRSFGAGCIGAIIGFVLAIFLRAEEIDEALADRIGRTVDLQFKAWERKFRAAKERQ